MRKSRPDTRRGQPSNHFCECGCGQYTLTAPKAIKRLGMKKGDAYKYLRWHYPGLGQPDVPGLPMRFRVNPVTGCWVWHGPTNVSGYGLVGRNNRALAHRLVWALVHGPIPAGMAVHHLCENVRCLNPAHLALVTPTEHAATRSRKRKRDEIEIITTAERLFEVVRAA